MTGAPASARTDVVTVGIPVRDGERYLPEVLTAVRAQAVPRELELLVLDSGSRDRSVEIARNEGATVVEIEQERFSHGAARNLIMQLSSGAHVAFLSQDATPVGELWLARLLECFELAAEVGLAFGPYEGRRESSAVVRRELRDYFGSFTPDGLPRIDRLEPGASAEQWRNPSPLTFFTDANGCVARRAWEAVPYRDVPYAEDHLLACDMLEAGYAKVFHPGAAVRHSHDYSSVALLGRCFDEWRGLREVYGYLEPLSPRRHLHRIRREVRADVSFLRESGAGRKALARGLLDSLRHHVVRALGSVLGSRANRLPARVRGALSLEGRSGFLSRQSSHPPRRDGAGRERQVA